MTISRENDYERRLARLRSRCCTGKVSMSMRAATSIAVVSRTPAQDPAIGPVEAYRCPFCADHENPDLEWHVGHAMSLASLIEMAAILRARSGNAPGPMRRNR
jgi:hypothetical protein